MSYELFYSDKEHYGPFPTMDLAVARAFQKILGLPHVYQEIAIVAREQGDWEVKRKRVTVAQVTLDQVYETMTAMEPIIVRHLQRKPLVQVVIAGGALRAVHGLPNTGEYQYPDQQYELLDFDCPDDYDDGPPAEELEWGWRFENAD